MTCDCISKVNASLVERGDNTEIEQLFRLSPTMGDSNALVRTRKADTKKRGRPTTVEATFCPFCGVKYPKPEAGEIEG